VLHVLAPEQPAEDDEALGGEARRRDAGLVERRGVGGGAGAGLGWGRETVDDEGRGDGGRLRGVAQGAY
jgi:hypothetical protein